LEHIFFAEELEKLFEHESPQYEYRRERHGKETDQDVGDGEPAMIRRGCREAS
jgi:hypothetical protein